MDTITTFLDQHPRTLLLLSSGKDSAACLKLLRPHLDRVMVTWVNPGNPYPETMDYMSRIQRTVPHFQMVLGLQPAFVKAYGHPADVVPQEATPFWRTANGGNAPRLVPTEACCNANLWAPALRALHEYGATGCIRGDKACDPLHSTVRNGDVIAGVEFHFPIFDWTDERVFEYLGDDVPPSYRRGLHTSLDCINCTAYTKENAGRLADLHEHYPDTWAEVAPIVHWMRDATRQHLAALEKL